MQTECGIITVVQEGRFRLASDDGRSLLFMLDASARVEPQDLPALLHGPRVRVAHVAAPGRHARVARDIRPAAAP